MTGLLVARRGSLNPRRPAAGGGPEIFDGFNRANEPLENSSDWVVDRQDADVVSNQLVVNAVKAFHQTALSSDDHYVEYTYVSLGSAALGAYLRHDSATSESNGYHARYNGQFGDWQIYRFTSGDITFLTKERLGTGSVADGDLVRFEISGSTIRILRNGVEMVSTTDSTHTVGKYVGLREGRGSTATIDDFKAGPL